MLSALNPGACVRVCPIHTARQAIVKRKLVVPEVYDLMDHMANLMIRSVVPNARQLCGHTFLLFLIKCVPSPHHCLLCQSSSPPHVLT